MTYEDAKQQIAEKYDHETFEDLIWFYADSEDAIREIENFTSEAVELYSEAKAKEAWNEAVKQCAKNMPIKGIAANNSDFKGSDFYVNVENIKEYILKNLKP